MFNSKQQLILFESFILANTLQFGGAILIVFQKSNPVDAYTGNLHLTIHETY